MGWGAWLVGSITLLFIVLAVMDWLKNMFCGHEYVSSGFHSLCCKCGRIEIAVSSTMLDSDIFLSPEEDRALHARAAEARRRERTKARSSPYACRR